MISSPRSENVFLANQNKHTRRLMDVTQPTSYTFKPPLYVNEPVLCLKKQEKKRKGSSHPYVRVWRGEGDVVVVCR